MNVVGFGKLTKTRKAADYALLTLLGESTDEQGLHLVLLVV